MSEAFLPTAPAVTVAATAAPATQALSNGVNSGWLLISVDPASAGTAALVELGVAGGPSLVVLRGNSRAIRKQAHVQVVVTAIGGNATVYLAQGSGGV